MLALSLAVYLIFYAIPSDPAQLGCGKPCTPDRLEQARKFMQLDRSTMQQYLDFLRGILVGRPFGEGIGAAVLWLVVGVGLGVAAALRRGRLLDRVAVGFALIGVAAPSFLVGLLAILVFGFLLNVVPVNGYVPFSQSPVDWAWHLITPWCVLAALSAASYIRLTRAQMLEEMNLDHIATARAKGASESRVVLLHGLRGALVPIVTLFGLDLGGLLGGAILTEKVFSMQGLGDLLLTAVNQADVAVVVGVTLFSAFLVIAANLVVDVVHGLLDPRVGHA